MITPKKIIKLIKSLPDAELHIHEYEGKQCVTSEFLCGGFAGTCFEANTIEEAAQQLINYLYAHINHDSLMGDLVRKSGFPDLEKVKKYCLNN